MPTRNRKPTVRKKRDSATRRREAARRREARGRAAIRRRAAEQREKRKRAGKRSSPAPLQEIQSEHVRLQGGQGTKGRGAGPGGSYWHIFAGDERVGHVYINVIDEPPFGTHPSIQIFLNKNQRGRRIGRVAYRMACEASGYDEVVAHMRKSNLASRRAAEEAGFVVVEDQGIPQLAMVWRRQSQR